ncbi:hypothetical protein RM96_16730 [Cupriavidus sp. IDO]|nr:hypothetical protein RM96_16730 [Cupriavidus sp. IDO]
MLTLDSLAGTAVCAGDANIACLFECPQAVLKFLAVYVSRRRLARQAYPFLRNGRGGRQTCTVPQSALG